MPYTLLNFLVWAILFALLGGVVGWALRALKARRDGVAARPVGPVDAVSVDPVSAAPVSADAVSVEPSPVDVDGAEAVLGRKIRSDDLTVVDGIGPKIAELCAGIGVTTWSELGRTDVDTLRAMLDDGGSGYKARDPSTWPRQGELLAAGQWDAFRALTAATDGDQT